MKYVKRVAHSNHRVTKGRVYKLITALHIQDDNGGAFSPRLGKMPNGKVYWEEVSAPPTGDLFILRTAETPGAAFTKGKIYRATARTGPNPNYMNILCDDGGSRMLDSLAVHHGTSEAWALATEATYREQEAQKTGLVPGTVMYHEGAGEFGFERRQGLHPRAIYGVGLKEHLIQARAAAVLFTDTLNSTKKEESKMVRIKKTTLVNDSPISSYSVEAILRLIEAEQSALDRLEKIGVESDSLTARCEVHKDNIKQLAGLIDEAKD